MMRIIACLAALLLASPAMAQTGSSKTVSALNTEVNTLFPDNTSGLITPNGLRQVALDIIASYPNLNSAGGPGSFTTLTATGISTFGASCAINQGGCWTVSNLITPPDNISWPVSFARIGATLTTANSGGPAGDNQWGLIVEVDIPSATGAVGSYEKAAGFFHCYTADPSGAGGTPERGCVGIETRGEIKTGNMKGQVWGLVAGAYVPAGTDGSSWALELDSSNNGSDQPTLFTDTSKYAIQAVSLGTFDTTAAFLVIKGPTNKFHKGFVANLDSLTSLGSDINASFIELTNVPNPSLFRIRSDGVELQLIPSSELLSTRVCTVTGTLCAQRFGVIPTSGSGAISDEFDLQFQFVNNTPASYTGIKIRGIQTAIAAGGTTQLTLSATTAGALTDVVNLNTGAWFPQTTEVVSNGGASNRWAVTYSVYESTKVQAVNALVTCNGTTEGWRAAVNNNNGVVFRANLVNGGTDHVAAYCNGTNWLVD